MLLRCNINAGVHARASGADVSLRDVTIAQMGNGATECGWRHAPEACGGFGGFWKSQLVELSSASGEDGWLSLAHRSQVSGLCGGCHTNWWGRGRLKSQNRKNVYLFPYVEEPLNSKVIKSFVPEPRSRVFRVSRFLCSMYICYEHHMKVSHISVSGYGTHLLHRDPHLFVLHRNTWYYITVY